MNGQQISRTVLSDDDLLTIGTHTFVFSGGTLEEYSVTDDTSLDAIGLAVTASGGAKLLQDVSFSLPSRSVLAVVGPSGAGKTTLLGALTGTLTPSSGQVSFAGRDLHESYDEFRSRIGVVPQDDLVHPQLTPRSELELTAALRLPTDIGRDGRSARVREVLAELGLQQRADLQIAKLSGGQRKRVSVGTELLTQPTLLFLDERTSGLDPGNEQQVMTVLRELADGGRIVVVVTHATQSLDLADRMLFLARGGRVAYFGPPDEALGYFARLSSQELEIAIAVALAGLAGMALGLAISALVRKSDQAVLLMPVVLVVEMALSLPLKQMIQVSDASWQHTGRPGSGPSWSC